MLIKILIIKFQYIINFKIFIYRIVLFISFKKTLNATFDLLKTRIYKFKARIYKFKTRIYKFKARIYKFKLGYINLN